MEVIVCLNQFNGIGFNGKIPWKSLIHDDFVNNICIGNGNNAIVMGVRTFKSMGFKPIPGIRNFIMTTNLNLYKIVRTDVVIEYNEENIGILPSIFDTVYILGGSDMYLLFEPYIKVIHAFYIHKDTPCDRFFYISLHDYCITKKKIYREPYHVITYQKYEK